MKANVHIYAVVRLKVEGAEGADPKACIAAALQATDLHRELPSGPKCEFAEEISHYLVDPVVDGEVNCDESRWFLDRAHFEESRNVPDESLYEAPRTEAQAA